MLNPSKDLNLTEEKSSFKVYIAGAMGNAPLHNIPIFFRAARAVKERFEITDLDIVNPAKIALEKGLDPLKDDVKNGVNFAKIIGRDLINLSECTDIVFIEPDWWNSVGARIEYMVATDPRFNIRCWIYNENSSPCLQIIDCDYELVWK